MNPTNTGSTPSESLRKAKSPGHSATEMSCQARRLEEQQTQFHSLVTRDCHCGFSVFLDERSVGVRSDALTWLRSLPEKCIHAVVTDPPYGLVEYEDQHHAKMRRGRGGIWRIPPAFDGAQRKPLPRFTVFTEEDTERLISFFSDVAAELHRVLVPGGHIFLASNPLVSTLTFSTFIRAGFEKRGEIIRLVQTLRGGDRPKGAHEEFPDVTVMPRSCWEPWGLFRKQVEGTVAENLRNWGTGALRRKSENEPFKDVIACSPTRSPEREIAPHPSLKPQRFLRQIVRASLPLGCGIVLDPFAGSGSTLAAASHLGYFSIGVERDEQYFQMCCQAFDQLKRLTTSNGQ
ncbi:MAG TPA: site-specific DNA-methyltransferase [Blastocatellia bacterium]|nr:site-specific DNA-methyltransferase [Blastocatellia bacterium]